VNEPGTGAGGNGSGAGGGAPGDSRNGNGGAGGVANGGSSSVAGGGANRDGSVSRDASPPTDRSAVDGPNGEAFDPTTGVLDVDRATYLSKHDLVFNTPVTDPLQAMMVGNGRMGAMVWCQNGLTLQISGVDTSQQTAFSSGLANLATTPAMDAAVTQFQQRLSLYDGVLTTKYDSDRTVTIMGSPNSEVMGIHVDDARTNVTNVSFELSLWDLSSLTNSGNVPDLTTWKTVTPFADSSGAGLSRGQTDANHFGYTLAASVDGAAFTASVVDNQKVRLTITPSPSYTIWITSATRLNAPNSDSLAQAKTLLGAVKAAGYTTTLAAYEAFWHAFWAKSFVQYSNGAGDADYLESFYYLASYVIGAGGYGTYPFHFINGVFRATQDNTKWSNAYWYWNQRDVYNSFFASNHGDLMSVFDAMYSNAASALKAYTMTRYGINGIWVPETMGWNGNADGTVNSDWTKNIYSTGTEAAENMYRQYLYSGDNGYLTTTAYPFIRDVANFYQSKLSVDGTSGQYYMASSNAHETYWNVQNAITDLAAVRSLFPIAIQTSNKLGVDTALAAGWQTVLDHLAPYPTDGTSYLPHDPPTVADQNDENVACELIWPYGVTGIGASDYAMALNTWNHRPHPYDNVWANDAIQAARLGLGDEALHGMETMLGKYQSYPNGMTNNTNGVFEYFGVHLSVMNEALLQSYSGTIRVFPASPSDPSFVGRFTLAAEGGFLVSSEKEAGDIKYVGLKSLNGNDATVASPWAGERVEVRDVHDDSIVAASSTPAITFPTSPGGVYIVQRAAKPIGDYTPSHLEGTPNQGVKRLPGTTCTLGISNPPATDAGK
jgi:hypothetical protein